MIFRCFFACTLRSNKGIVPIYLFLICWFQDAATRSHCGDLSNPLLVLPLLSSTTNSGYQFEDKQAEADNDGELNNIVGAGYHAYEDSVLKKLQKVRFLELCLFLRNGFPHCNQRHNLDMF